MKLYFDVSTVDPKKVTGVGVYMLQLMRQLQKHKNIEFNTCMKASRIKKRNEIDHWNRKNVNPNLQKSKIIFPFEFLQNKEKLIYHGPDFRLNMKGALKKIVTIHDLIVFEQGYNAKNFSLQGQEDMRKLLTKKNL